MIVNQNEIKKYIARHSGQNVHVSALMQETLYKIIILNADCFEPVTSIKDLPSKSLRSKFRNAHRDWYFFKPYQGLDKVTKDASEWLTESLESIGRDYAGVIKALAHDRVRKIKTLDDLVLAMESNLLSQDEINYYWDRRIIPDEEFRNHIRHEHSLKGRNNLIRILTPKGMMSAGKNAQNCLGFNNLPNNLISHKKRVLKPREWLYFSIRDADNRSVATILLNVRRGTLTVEGNAQKPVPDSVDHLVFEAIDYIEKQYPHAVKNYQYRSHRYYTWKKYRTWENKRHAKQNHNPRWWDGAGAATYRRAIPST